MEVVIYCVNVVDIEWGKPSHNVDVGLVGWSSKKASLGNIFLHISPIEVGSLSFEVEGRYARWIVLVPLLLVRDIPPKWGTWSLLGSSSLFFQKFLLTPIKMEFMLEILLVEITYVEGVGSGGCHCCLVSLRQKWLSNFSSYNFYSLCY